MKNLLLGLVFILLHVSTCFASHYEEQINVTYFVGTSSKFSDVYSECKIRPSHRLEDIWKDMEPIRQFLGLPEIILESEINSAPKAADRQLFRELYNYLHPSDANKEHKPALDNPIRQTSSQPDNLPQHQPSTILSMFSLASLREHTKTPFHIQRNLQQPATLLASIKSKAYKNGNIGSVLGMPPYQPVSKSAFIPDQASFLSKWVERTGNTPTLSIQQSSLTHELDTGLYTASPSKFKIEASPHASFPYQDATKLSFRFDFLSLLNPLPLLKMITLDVAQALIFLSLLFATFLLTTDQHAGMEKLKKRFVRKYG